MLLRDDSSLFQPCDGFGDSVFEWHALVNQRFVQFPAPAFAAKAMSPSNSLERTFSAYGADDARVLRSGQCP